jgi:fructose-specific component phosphotransferase system IIB-like protein
MTSQPDSPVTDRIGIDEDAMDAAQDPDLVIVAGEVVEEDADPVGAETDTDGGNDPTVSDPTVSDSEDYATGDPDLVATEAAGTTALADTPPDAYPADDSQNETDLSGGGSLGESARPADLSQQ